MKKNKKPTVKNVALCFSGQVKKLELCYPYIKKNLLDHFGSYDIFCFAEDDKDFKKISLLNPVKAKKIESSEVDKMIKSRIKFLNKLNYKKIIYPESFRFNFRNIYQQYFKIKKSFELLEKHMKEKNISYKYFIRIRFDFLPLDSFKLESFKMKKNEVVVPDFRGIRSKNEIFDMLYITKDFNTFKFCCSLYDNFEKIAQKEISIKTTFSQKLYFLFEKSYIYFFFFLFKKLDKKQRKFPRQLLGLFLLFPKMFYKKFKFQNETRTERIFFYHLKSGKKIIKEKKINFVIVRNLTDGLLIFG